MHLRGLGGAVSLPRGVRGAATKAIDFQGISVLDTQFPGISELKSGADIRLIYGMTERDNHKEKNTGKYILTCFTLLYVRQKEELPCFSQQYQGKLYVKDSRITKCSESS